MTIAQDEPDQLNQIVYAMDEDSCGQFLATPGDHNHTKAMRIIITNAYLQRDARNPSVDTIFCSTTSEITDVGGPFPKATTYQRIVQGTLQTLV
eukprot:CAMPEP_0116549978 /NCGR_PEP_ID=MMETSP0397-20121206/5175_1 /TAXON_ID=216820 /ORGANISM="Cyclophora tenuis, Strain ECT3854" /LENGTH=93 /DNA_ID=CAMNT_0004074765 /DNA_START=277 /DNA_END=554 /DNA_ORIENTATION=+